MEHNFPTIPSERADDLHHLEYADRADLVLFMAGNQFMAMEEIMTAFQSEYPEVERIFYETLPPGLELKQILAGGAIFKDKIIEVIPDIYTSVSLKAMQILEDAGTIKKGEYHLYLHNRLTLMVPPGNPANIKTVTDLGRDEVRISQPDPANEDIAFHIMDMYRQAGGDRLVERIMEEKRGKESTLYTIVHHRETPLRIAEKTVDVGPIWATEAVHAAAEGFNFDVVEPGEDLDRRGHVNYYVCKLSRSPNPENAQNFLAFIQSSTALKIYKKYGFITLSDF
jgi:ABC-type molybdate transport system substrate-binding protein